MTHYRPIYKNGMKLFLLTFLLLTFLFSFAQKEMPIIKAGSKNVAVNDGGYFEKNAWSLSPETNPDVYTADRSLKPKWVTFYTDIDSSRVKIKPGTIFDFIILPKGKDTCYTRIVSSTSVKSTMRLSGNKSDSISFTLNKYDAIHVKSIINNSDTLNMHFDLGTLDFRLTRDALSTFNLKNINKIQIGNLTWDSPKVQIANKASHQMDGRFGWRAFDGKVIEIDYDKNLIIVHSNLLRIEKGFIKAKIKFIQSLFCIEGTIKIDNKNYTGNFLFDTGSDLAMVLDSSWMSNLNFPGSLTMIKKSSFSDGAGRKYETTIVEVPLLSINGFAIKDIPASKLGFNSPVGSQINYFGNDLLKRFNIIIDLRADEIYLKPNGLYYLPFNKPK